MSMQHHDEFDDNSEQPVELSAPVDDHGEQHRRLRLTIPSRLDDCLLESEVFYRTISKSTTGSTTSTSIVPRRTAIIISHPYGPLGGDMHNNVVDALWETLCEVGGSSIVLRYNARGVCGSQGATSWTGSSEVEDGASIIEYLLGERQRKDNVNDIPAVDGIVLCGYSYGAMTLCACASAFPQRIRAIIAVSYPLQVTWLLSLFNTNRLYDGAFGALVASSSSANIAPTTEHHPPTLFIIGTRDQFTSAAKLERFVRERVKDPKQIEVVDGADHFWFGREEQVCALVVNFLQRWGVLTATAH